MDKNEINIFMLGKKMEAQTKSMPEVKHTEAYSLKMT